MNWAQAQGFNPVIAGAWRRNQMVPAYQNIDPNYTLDASVQDTISGVGQFTALVVDKAATTGNTKLAALGVLFAILAATLGYMAVAVARARKII
jgi:hypothetical protein